MAGREGAADERRDDGDDRRDDDVPVGLVIGTGHGPGDDPERQRQQYVHPGADEHSLRIEGAQPGSRRLVDGHGHPTSPNGDGKPSFPGLRMPFGSSVDFRAASTSKEGPRASRMKRERLSPTPWWW